jgi:PiT family inorganic phosphate transporter
MLVILVIAALFLAYWNGANDNFKGVATLYGSGTVNYRTAITIATIATLAGSICAIFLAQGLVARFSGKGLVPESTAGGIEFLMAVGFGAALTVLLATRLGYPISTTHSLVGGLMGAGLMAIGGDVDFKMLGSTFFLPLIASPFIALLLGASVYWIFTHTRKTLGLTKESCIYVGEQREYVSLTTLAQGDTAATAMNIGLENIAPPKLAVAIAVGIALGGLLNARRVAETISNKITDLNHGQGFSANLVTGILVIFASNLGLPVSTTHVSVGSIFGIGMGTGKRNTKVIGNILISWIITLPVAMALSALAYLLLA